MPSFGDTIEGLYGHTCKSLLREWAWDWTDDIAIAETESSKEEYDQLPSVEDVPEYRGTEEEEVSDGFGDWNSIFGRWGCFWRMRKIVYNTALRGFHAAAFKAYRMGNTSTLRPLTTPACRAAKTFNICSAHISQPHEHKVGKAFTKIHRLAGYVISYHMKPICRFPQISLMLNKA